jgi:hypothetical protein
MIESSVSQLLLVAVTTLLVLHSTIFLSMYGGSTTTEGERDLVVSLRISPSLYKIRIGLPLTEGDNGTTGVDYEC